MSARMIGRLWFACAVASTAAVPGARASAQAAQFNHSAIIDRTLREIGGIAAIDRARPEQRTLLASHFSERGQFLLDLYEFERVIVRDHALHRDSLAKHGAPAVPAAQYFLGRALQEAGQAREASAAYASLAASAPEAVRSLAETWKATLGPGGGRSWQQDVVTWRSGKGVTPSACPTASSVCDLFVSLLGDDADAIVRAQRAVQAAPPDHSETVRSGGVTYAVEFYDPLSTYLLAISDFALAARVLREIKGVPQVDAFRAIALYRAGRAREAEPMLRQASPTGSAPSRASVWLGELLYRAGNAAEAENVWRGATGATLNMVIDARSRLGSGGAASRQAVSRQYEAERSRRFQGMREGTGGGEFLARALLRYDMTAQALEVLGEVRPPSAGTSLDRVRPAVLTLTAHVRYSHGRREHLTEENYPFARGDIAALTDDFPASIPVLKILQLVTAPGNVSAVRSNPLRFHE